VPSEKLLPAGTVLQRAGAGSLGWPADALPGRTINAICVRLVDEIQFVTEPFAGWRVAA
jgi:hypothetical protein